ncbi:hypothetical protein RN001_008757 [Aquatica leii]|uniref:Tyr recombinase domain-containing protein n=1 Tax=Aquatica leii TaxID=1421715 RepID=A0AAN7PHN2_9COLE|nr:hypothetical protein RN001_008757 [Aquatica leii]
MFPDGSITYHMKKCNGEDYKDSTLKTMWNTTAKMVQELYFNSFNVKMDPFSDIEFKSARAARDGRRKHLQTIAEKRKVSSVTILDDNYEKMIDVWNEDIPSGGGEAAKCSIEYFQEEKQCNGKLTGRYEYTIFSKTCQGGSHRLCDSKWLVSNEKNPSHCPVRLLKKMLQKMGCNVVTDRLFLTANPNSCEPGIWYKNIPVGINEIGKWTKKSAEKAGLDVKRFKITNHSTRSSAVTQLAKSGVKEQLIKITGHSSASSIRFYLQLDTQHHAQITSKMRKEEKVQPMVNNSCIQNEETPKIVYNNCVINNNHC